jgi:cytochrome c oxidase cbb3-type subunit III
MKIFLIVGALVLAGCEGNTRLRDTQGATPGVETPVGPVPGPGVAAHSNPNPYSPADPIAATEGRRWFKLFNCSGCHGGHAGGGMGPSLRDVDWLYGDTDAQIFDSIAEGRSQGMPAWGTKVPEDLLWKLVAYIKSLRTANEPDRPALAVEAKAPPAAVMPGKGEVETTPRGEPGERNLPDTTNGGHEHVEPGQ